VSDFNHAALAYVPFGMTTFTTTITGGLTTIVHGQDMVVDTTTAPNLLYLANFTGSGNVLAFSTADSGNAAPALTVSAPSGPKSVALDNAGHLWVSDDGASAIYEFSLPLAGGDTPINTISGPNTGLNNPGGIAVASNGTIYVSQNQNGATVAQFAPGATGNATPVRVATVAGPSVDNVVLDRFGYLWIMDADVSGAIKRYDPATMPVSGAWSPLATINGPGDPVSIGTVY
jgi:streptogramin lyase